MNRLTIALGITRKAANARKPRKYMTIPPRMIRPSTIPSMKPNELIGIIHGKYPDHIAKKTGESKARPLATIKLAAMKSSATGKRKWWKKSGRGNGPYQTPGASVCTGGCCIIGAAIICGVGAGAPSGTRLL